MFCSQCGTSNPDNGNFCFSCGTALFKVKESSLPPSVPTATEPKKIEKLDTTGVENHPIDSLAENRKVKKPFWKTWLKCTVWILVLGCFLGLGSGGMEGLIVAIVTGIIMAPIKGAILAYIIRAWMC